MSTLCYCFCCYGQFEQNMETKDKNYCSKFLIKYAFNITVDIENLFKYENAEVEVCPTCFEKLEDVCVFRNQVEETLIRFSKIVELQAIKEENITSSDDDDNFDTISSPEISDDEFLIKLEEGKLNSSRKKAPEKLLKKPAETEKSNVDIACKVCPESFKNKVALRLHYKSIHLYKFTCFKCGIPFETHRDCKVHRKTHSPLIPCSKCGKVIPTYNMYSHMKYHDKIPTNSCTSCPERFHCPFDKRKHMEQVHGIPMPIFICDICQKIFNRKTTLQKHIRSVHIRDKKYKCDKCEKSFVQKSYLTRHQIHHTGERNHECEICQKRFYNLNTLRMHLKIHDSIKEHVCHICGRAFTQKCTLKGHLLTHNTDKKTNLVKKKQNKKKKS